MAHLFRLLRPEFVKKYKNPLCSGKFKIKQNLKKLKSYKKNIIKKKDGFSAFIKNWDPKNQNTQLMEATNYLKEVKIPKFAVKLVKMLKAAQKSKGITAWYDFRISEAVHRAGINIRYLGVLRKNVTQSDVRTYLLIEVNFFPFS
jgi:hypothetical protein